MIKSKQVAASTALTFRGLILAASLGTLILALTLTSASSGVRCQEQLTVESRHQKNRDDLTDTIEYLENLDKYLTRLSAPRFGRSEYKQQQQQHLNLRQNDYNLGEMVRYAPGPLSELINAKLGQRFAQSF